MLSFYNFFKVLFLETSRIHKYKQFYARYERSFPQGRKLLWYIL